MEQKISAIWSSCNKPSILPHYENMLNGRGVTLTSQMNLKMAAGYNVAICSLLCLSNEEKTLIENRFGLFVCCFFLLEDWTGDVLWVQCLMVVVFVCLSKLQVQTVVPARHCLWYYWKRKRNVACSEVFRWWMLSKECNYHDTYQHRTNTLHIEKKAKTHFHFDFSIVLHSIVLKMLIMIFWRKRRKKNKTTKFNK